MMLDGVVWAMLALPGAAAPPAEYCALTVTVVDAALKPMEGVGVTTVGAKGRRQVWKNSGKNGSAAFCDLDGDTYEVVVGGPTCGQTRVAYLEVAWPGARQVKVIYSPCHGFPAPRPYCSLVVRVRAEAGDPLPGAAVRFQGGKSTPADSYGRVFSALNWGAKTTLEVSADGHETFNRRVECAKGETEKRIKVSLPPRLAAPR
jgi:hypothetical protein